MKVFSARTNFICLTVAIGGLLFGFDTAVISGAVGLIKSQFVLDTTREGWFVSSGLVGCILGVLITGALRDRIGRRNTIFFSDAAFLFSVFDCVSSVAFVRFISAPLAR